MNPRLKIGKLLLDSVYERLQRTDPIHETLDDMVLCLKELRDILQFEDWNYFSSRQCLEHPLRNLLHQDPFTRRVFTKPRGYPGDAVMLDFIYRENSTHHEIQPLSALVKEIYEHSTTSPASKAVINRRDMIAHMVDDMAEEIESPHILSLACGHLREAKHTTAIQQGKIGRYVAFDYDKECLKLIQNEFGKNHVQCIHGNIKDIILGKIPLENFDFIYAAGLFDYLREPVAQKLANTMFNSLRPNGKLVICNFLRNIRDVGYMESFMDWKLIYRSQDELDGLCQYIPHEQILEKKITVESHENIAFLEVRKQ